MAGLVLIINAYGTKRSGLVINSTKELVDVSHCMKAIKTIETRYVHITNVKTRQNLTIWCTIVRFHYAGKAWYVRSTFKSNSYYA